MKTLKILTITNKDNYRQKDIFLLDGVQMSEGMYGGEPEDNTKVRDYSWVQDVVEKIAKELGATFELEHKEVSADEFYS